MHNAAFAALGIEDEWSYEAIVVLPDEFERRVRAMPGEGFVGANVTVPHKGAALLLSDRRSEIAREIGAANTLVFEAGEIRAHNTDAKGLMEVLPRSPTGRRALVLGAGGSARAAVWALGRVGAEVWVWNRTSERSAQLCAQLGGRVDLEPQAGEYELIVNSTTVGLRGEDPFTELPLSRESLRSGQTVIDFVYGDAESELLRAAREAGADVVDGLRFFHVPPNHQSQRRWIGFGSVLCSQVGLARVRGLAGAEQQPVAIPKVGLV